MFSTSHQTGQAGSPDAVASPAMDSEGESALATEDAVDGQLTKADRIRIENAAKHYLLEDNAGAADDWSTF